MTHADKLVGRIRTVLFLSVFTFQPNAIKAVIELLNCINLNPDSTEGNYYYIYTDMRVKCYTDDHLKWVWGLVTPTIIFFGVLYPILSLIFLIKAIKTKIFEELFKKIGFQIQTFGADKHYWYNLL